MVDEEKVQAAGLRGIAILPGSRVHLLAHGDSYDIAKALRALTS
jgi:hypothetical protein